MGMLIKEYCVELCNAMRMISLCSQSCNKDDEQCLVYYYPFAIYHC